MDVTMSFEKTSSDSCILEFKSDVEGIATTYANLYRRTLLQSTPCYSVAGLRCSANGKYAKNFFEILPGMTASMVDINTTLYNAVFDIDSDDNVIIISIELGGKTMLSDITDKSKISVKYGTSVDSITLRSQDKVLTNVVGNNNITLDIFLKKGVGFSNRDVNLEALKTVVSDSEIKSWIVGDSQHRGVMNVSYHSDVRLGKQTIKMEVKSYQNNIESVIDNCTKHILKNMNSFLETE